MTNNNVELARLPLPVGVGLLVRVADAFNREHTGRLYVKQVDRWLVIFREQE